MKPLICITAGDIAGVGPEIIAKSLQENSFFLNQVRLLIIGPKKILFNAIEKYSTLSKQINVINSAEESTANINLLDITTKGALDNIPMGKISKTSGLWAYRYVETAIQMAMDKQISAIVTAPINKTAWQKAGVGYGGHTELLADKSATTNYAMGFYSRVLKVVLETIHIPLADVPKRISSQSIYNKILLANQFLKRLKIRNPRICVAGLNPHAGENGLLGSEEETIIKPAVLKAQQSGVTVDGPYPSDTAFYLAYQEHKFDLIVSMYHDQALAPLKMVALHDAVNITLGLPFVRTSPDHGTAFDIAGSGTANPQSMIEAITLASDLVN